MASESTELKFTLEKLPAFYRHYNESQKDNPEGENWTKLHHAACHGDTDLYNFLMAWASEEERATEWRGFTAEYIRNPHAKS